MWSDPDDVEDWGINARGAGWNFGGKVTKQFNELNGLELVARAHQLAQQGYQYWFKEESLVTVWSVPNYCYKCGNDAAILSLD
jgi:serine/threonine-protein phosphatase 6 catalytic subunit